MPSIMWRRADHTGLERAVFEFRADGTRLSGTTLVVSQDEPFEIRWSVITAPDGSTVTVGAHLQGESTNRHLSLSSDGAGAWSTGDDPVLELYGATDVDLGWTPATNTLAIRRLGLDIGETGETTVVRIPFPERDIERMTHRYTKLAADRYEYRSGEATATLTVDEHGIVTDYPQGWIEVARSSP